jgi:hypothetical protein
MYSGSKHDWLKHNIDLYIKKGWSGIVTFGYLLGLECEKDVIGLCLSIRNQPVFFFNIIHSSWIQFVIQFVKEVATMMQVMKEWSSWDYTYNKSM